MLSSELYQVGTDSLKLCSNLLTLPLLFAQSLSCATLTATLTALLWYLMREQQGEHRGQCQWEALV